MRGKFWEGGQTLELKAVKRIVYKDSVVTLPKFQYVTNPKRWTIYRVQLINNIFQHIPSEQQQQICHIFLHGRTSHGIKWPKMACNSRPRFCRNSYFVV